MRVITYESNNQDDNNRYIGLVAEELAASDDPILHYLVSYDKDGLPDSVNYDRVSMIVVPAVQRIIAKLIQFNNRIAANKDKLDANELAIADNTTKVTAGATAITNLRGRVTKLETDLAAALLRISALEAVRPPVVP